MHGKGLATLLAVFMVAAFVGHFGLHLKPHITGKELDFVIIPLVATLFCLLNSLALFGWRQTLAFAIAGGAISYLSEALGVSTGLIFGRYVYGDALGPKLGEVPWLIPAYWFMIVYLATVISNLIARGKPDYEATSWPSILWLGLLTGFVATAYDLGLDPYMSSAEVGAWTWLDGGSYFGVPPHNFIGWVATALVISVVVRWLFLKIERHPLGNTPRLTAVLPVATYFVFWLGHLSNTYTPPVRTVSLIAIGIPAVGAVSAFYHYWKDASQPTPSP